MITTYYIPSRLLPEIIEMVVPLCRIVLQKVSWEDEHTRLFVLGTPDQLDKFNCLKNILLEMDKMM